MINAQSTSIKRVSSAAANLSALVDDIAKRARRNFRESGSPDVDAKFLKESVSALKDLLDIIDESDGGAAGAEAITVRMEGDAAQWGK